MCAIDSRRISREWGAAAICTVAALATSSSFGADAKKDQEQVRRLRQQIQQMQQEQAAQQEQAGKVAQDKAAAEAALKKVQEELGAARSAATGSSRRVTALTKDLDEVKTERDDLKSKLAQLQSTLDKSQSDLQSTRDTLTSRNAEWSSLDAAYKAQSASLNLCRTHNAKLFDLGSELLSRYQGKGWAEVLGQGEPFVQTKRVELENLAQDYRDKLTHERLVAPTSPAASSP